MSIENIKITAYLKSPIVGDPPFLDALLTYELAFCINNKSNKYNKSTPIKNFERLPIPLVEFDIGNEKVNSCSNPIYKITAEWNDKFSKRFDTCFLSLLIDSDKRKTINTGGGYLRSRFQSIHVKVIDKVIWFARGDKEECQKLLNRIISIGYFRKMGYGLIAKWNVEKIKENNSIFVYDSGKKILMKTIPKNGTLKNLFGIRYGYGAFKPPYWHPQNQKEIVIPC